MKSNFLKKIKRKLKRGKEKKGIEYRDATKSRKVADQHPVEQTHATHVQDRADTHKSSPPQSFGAARSASAPTLTMPVRDTVDFSRLDAAPRQSSRERTRETISRPHKRPDSGLCLDDLHKPHHADDVNDNRVSTCHESTTPPTELPQEVEEEHEKAASSTEEHMDTGAAPEERKETASPAEEDANEKSEEHEEHEEHEEDATATKRRIVRTTRRTSTTTTTSTLAIHIQGVAPGSSLATELRRWCLFNAGYYAERSARRISRMVQHRIGDLLGLPLENTLLSVIAPSSWLGTSPEDEPDELEGVVTERLCVLCQEMV